jgi:ATP-dependent DNA ligase
LRPKKRGAKWVKTENDEDLDVVCEIYECNRNIAKDYLSLLSKDQLEIIKKEKSKGGLGK